MLLLPKAGRRLSGLWGVIDRSGRCARWLQGRESVMMLVGYMGHICDLRVIVSSLGGHDDGWGLTGAYLRSARDGFNARERLSGLWGSVGRSGSCARWPQGRESMMMVVGLLGHVCDLNSIVSRSGGRDDG